MTSETNRPEDDALGTEPDAPEVAESTEPTQGAHAGRSKPKHQKKSLPVWQESILLMVTALVLAVAIKTFLLQAFYIPSESMEPGLVKDDRIMVQKPSYWMGSPQRGDVVVFQDPGGWLSVADEAPTNLLSKALTKVGLYPTGGHLVKRVIGTEGDTIVCCDEQGRLSVNGEPLDEVDYVQQDGSRCAGPMTGSCQWTAGPVPAGKLFVMGDNRAHSADSSWHMCAADDTTCVPGNEYVDTDQVVGKVFALVWPLDRFTILKRPADFSGVPDPE